MDPQLLPPPAPQVDSIGDDTWSVVNWLSAFPELFPWLAVGALFGSGVVLTGISGMISAGEQFPKWLGFWLAAFGPMMIIGATIGVYVASRSFSKREESKRRRARAEKHDEMIGHIEREQAICVEQFTANRLLREELIEERKAIRAAVEAEHADRIARNKMEVLSLWTPDAVKDRIAIILQSSRFSDMATPECALLLQWRVVSIVGVPHTIEILGGTCDLYPLGSGSMPVEYLDLRSLPALSLDGKLSPEELSMQTVPHKSVLNSTQRAAIQAALGAEDVARIIVTLKCSATVNGNNIPMDFVIEPFIVALPRWANT